MDGVARSMKQTADLMCMSEEGLRKLLIGVRGKILNSPFADALSTMATLEDEDFSITKLF